MSRDLEFLAAQMVTSRRRDQFDRERLAEASHRKQCASHKGRNHWANWERRQIIAEKRANALKTAEIKRAKGKRYLDMVREYWAGLRDSLPA